MGEFLYGTSSWSEKSWAGAFYPAGLSVSSQLAHYATPFRTVEADVTYYRVPDARLVSGWSAKTPDNFVLSAKFPQSVVHGGKESQPDPQRVLVHEHVGADVERFLLSMSLLGEKCGPLVLQFPYFNQRAFPTVEPFLERLDGFLARLPTTFRYGVEVRNKHWIGEPLLGLLRRHRTALVLVDLAYMPHPADLAQQHDLFTTDFTYARLIGDRKAIDALTDRFDKLVVDQSPRLAKWAELLRQASNRLPRIFAYANNHYAGYAPETIRDLVGRMS
ncbi:MAG TPA: DUF72 domain-containing protein [Planctomycetota bacterium]|nr:DUF72 domain-containing protein [Planctomycetota bacterium]